MVHVPYLRLCFEYLLVKNINIPTCWRGHICEYYNSRTYIFQIIVLSMLHIGLVGLHVYVLCFLIIIGWDSLQCEQTCNYIHQSNFGHSFEINWLTLHVTIIIKLSTLSISNWPNPLFYFYVIYPLIYSMYLIYLKVK